jgi:hypothetical protein
MHSAMNVRTFLFVGMLATSSAFAQGTLNIEYTWHGNSGYFAASFQIPPDEYQPGQYFDDGTFASTFRVNSPDATYPSAGGYFAGDDASGFGPPLALSVTMTDPAAGTGVLVAAHNGFYAIYEYPLSNPSANLWVEGGYWTSAPIPEPWAVFLLPIAGAAWAVCSWRRSIAPRGICPTLRSQVEQR